MCVGWIHLICRGCFAWARGCPYRYDWKKEQTTEPAINAVMTTINKKFCSCGTGSVAKIGGYRGFGTTTDYMYAFLRLMLMLQLVRPIVMQTEFWGSGSSALGMRSRRQSTFIPGRYLEI